MKQFNAVAMLLLSMVSYSQTSVKPESGASSIDQYLWSFAKNKATAGKPLIDFDAMDSWRGLGNYLAVSDDGSYFAYTINKVASYTNGPGLWDIDTLVIQSTKNGQGKAFAGIEPGFFSADSKQYIFQDGEALCFLQLSRMKVRKVEGVASYKISGNKWLAYKVKDTSVVLQNLLTGKTKTFASTVSYDFSSNGEWLICQGTDKELLMYNVAKGIERKFSCVDSYLLAENGKSLLFKTVDSDKKIMNFVSLPEGDVKTIWSGSGKADSRDYSFDVSGKKIVFLAGGNGDAAPTSVWYFKEGMDKAIIKVTPKTFSAQTGLTLSSVLFSDNGHFFRVDLQKAPDSLGEANPQLAGLEVWNHKDVNLQSAQSKQIKKSRYYRAIVAIESGKVVFEEGNSKRLLRLQRDFALLMKDYTDLLGGRFWEKGRGSNVDSFWIVNLKDGNTHLLPTQSNYFFWLSPSGDYLVYFDPNKGCHYFSCNLNTGRVTDISANVPENQLGFKRMGVEGEKPSQGSLAAWLENESSVLVYDDYDIWKLDLTGKQPAVNVTGGFGVANGIILNLFSSSAGRFVPDKPTIQLSVPLMLRGFNPISKQTGFYKKNDINIGDPVELNVDNYFTAENRDANDPNVVQNYGLPPVKAKNASIWIVQRQSTNDAPNYYYTGNFKNFKRLTNFQPQKKYQWFTEEVVAFKHLNGKTGQGILYKPENFDPNKKYPVLIPFYGFPSNNMFQFPLPTYVSQAMAPCKSPVWFLNNGYLVFTPDMTSQPLKLGPSSFNALEGAIQYLKQLPYVDANKLGCASHSAWAKYGAYLLTHSTSLSATALSEGFGYGDLINQAFNSTSLSGEGRSYLDATEQGGYGELWENKNVWLDMTTVVQADKAISPVLLLSNKESTWGAQEETWEIFTAFQRLEKNVWWLKYDKGGHVLGDPNELKDYTVRYTQFFDHYLKNAPAPLWMTQGVPYRLKGIESRFELDPLGSCVDADGAPCVICKAWNAQYKKTPEMFTKDIKDWKLDKDIAEELDRKQNEKRKQLDKEGAKRTKQILQMLNEK